MPKIKPLSLYIAILITLLCLTAYASDTKETPPLLKKNSNSAAAPYQTDQSDPSSVKTIFTKEYTYKHVKADRKFSIRTMAFELVKHLLLEELAEHLKVKIAPELHLSKKRIALLSAFLVRPDIIEEKSTVETYYLKAQISFNPDKVINSLRSIAADKEKANWIADSGKKAVKILNNLKDMQQAMEKEEKIQDRKIMIRYYIESSKLVSINHLQRAYALLDSDKYNEAIKVYNTAVDSLIPYPAAYFQRGTAYYSHQAYDPAIKDFELAIKLKPDYMAAYIYLGNTYNKLGNYRKTISALDKAVSKGLKNEALSLLYPEIYLIRGIAYTGIGNYQKALEHHDYAIISGLKSVEVYYNRGIEYYRLGRFEEGISDFQKAIAINPEFAEGYYYRGLSYKQMGRPHYRQAVFEFERAVKYKPAFTNAHMEKGLVSLELGNYVQAVIALSRAIENDPKLIKGYTNRGRAFIKSGLIRNALEDYNKALVLDPKRAESYNERGLYYMSAGRYENALMDLSIAIELNQEEAEFFKNRAGAYHLLRYYSEAVTDFDRSISIDPLDSNSYTGRGNANLYNGNADKSIDDFVKAIELAPDYFEAYSYLGNAYSHLGKHGQAIQYFTKAIDLNPSQDKGIYYNRGKAYYNQGSFKKSVEDFKEDGGDEYSKIHMLLALSKISMEQFDDTLQKFKHYVQTSQSRKWIRTISRYYLGYDGVNEKSILSEATKGADKKETADRLCEAYYYLAEMRLMKNDQKGAEEFFNKSIKGNNYNCIVYTSSKAMLESIK